MMGLKSKIVGLLFWTLFILSLALNDGYRWINRVWSIGLWLLALASVPYFIAQAIRHRRITGTSGYPRWFLRFAYDDDEQEHADKDQLDLQKDSRGGTERS